jgi:hypothetical protein
MRKMIYKTTRNYNESLPNNGFGAETESVIFEDNYYEVEDWLRDNLDGEYDFNHDGEEETGIYRITRYGEETGEVYNILSVEPINEEEE